MKMKAGGLPCFEWTAERDARVRELWATGVSTANIAAELGTTKSSIIGRARRIGVVARPSPINQFNAELQAAVRAALQDGISPCAFARDAGRGKSQIWRIAQRLRGQEGITVPRLCRDPDDMPRKVKDRPAVAIVSDGWRATPGAATPPPLVASAGECVRSGLPAPSPAEDVAIPQPRGPRCLFPMWGTGRTVFRDGEPWFCGAPRDRGSYCATHGRICYERPRVMEAVE